MVCEGTVTNPLADMSTRLYVFTVPEELMCCVYCPYGGLMCCVYCPYGGLMCCVYRPSSLRGWGAVFTIPVELIYLCLPSLRA